MAGKGEIYTIPGSRFFGLPACFGPKMCSRRARERMLMRDRPSCVHWFAAAAAVCVLSIHALLTAAQTGSGATAQSDWLTWGYDQERSLWNRAEKELNKDNVGQLSLKWKTQMPTPASTVVLQTLTTPLVAMVNLPQGPVARV